MARVRESLQQKLGKQIAQGAGVAKSGKMSGYGKGKKMSGKGYGKSKMRGYKKK